MSSRDRWLILVMVMVSFATTLTCELTYERLHVFEQANTLFDADPDRFIISFADSWDAGTHFRHPLIEFVFSVPIRTAARATCAVAACDRAAFRHDLALLVVPLAEAIKTALVYWVSIGLGLTLWQAALLCALNLFSLSTLTVGSVPETYAISSMLITGFIALMIGVFHSRRIAGALSWIVAGALAIGVTVTNAGPLAIFFFLSRTVGRGETLWQAFRKTAVVMTVATVLTFVTAASLTRLMSSNRVADLMPAAELGDLGLAGPGVPVAEQLAVAGASTFAGVIAPELIPNRFASNSLHTTSTPVLPFRITYETRRFAGAATVLWTIVFLGMLAVGAWRVRTRSLIWSAMVVGCLLTVAFNAVLHSQFYLHDMFLFALHWQAPMLFLLAGLLPARTGSSFAYGFIAIVALTVASAVSGCHVISNLARASQVARACTSFDSRIPSSPSPAAE
jgi:hypothetical protein